MVDGYKALTVGELIKALQELDKDAQVFIYEGSVLSVSEQDGYVMLDTDYEGTP